ncbi:Gfo/Idh/MocA family oxidoreductase [Psychroflexus aestuariivivens]|uniref:Gfo/Idh/MocA family oxidoreductase n=1 Tax=Psychroflexus aestuariivivens TaxID=1795040 RepID=UPI000FDC237B|nr:Gfo/Idh/MocA family oxidoreductase [Psychroflexus aestuariivivens]
MAAKLKIGIIGMSEGNGHPYSWAAIFNGYNKNEMSRCPFPVIPEYLSQQIFPDDFLTHRAEVSHIWTQNVEVTKHIALCSNIPNICNTIEEMVSNVDAVLLARDDAENHLKYAKPVLKAGIPIYIDKPFALNTTDADKLLNLAKHPNQIFTCSALQFAEEFQLINLDLAKIGAIKSISAMVPKSWEKYAVHIIEPVLNLIPERGNIKSIERIKTEVKDIISVQVNWTSEITANFQTFGKLGAPLSIRIVGTEGYKDLYIKDTYSAFKSALNRFLDVIEDHEPNISREFTMEMIQILEKGQYA